MSERDRRKRRRRKQGGRTGKKKWVDMQTCSHVISLLCKIISSSSLIAKASATVAAAVQSKVFTTDWQLRTHWSTSVSHLATLVLLAIPKVWLAEAKKPNTALIPYDSRPGMSRENSTERHFFPGFFFFFNVCFWPCLTKLRHPSSAMVKTRAELCLFTMIPSLKKCTNKVTMMGFPWPSGDEW